MATKTIVRWKPSVPVYGQREFSVADFESVGIFTQRRNVVFTKDGNFWLDAEAAEISKEALDWLVANPDSFGEVTVEQQNVPDPTPASAGTDAVVDGESTSESSTAAGKANTTTSRR